MTVYRRPDPIPLRRSVSPQRGTLLAVRAEPEDLNRLAAREIFQAIAAGRFAAGSILPNEFELAGELGVSRTVLREAIKGLGAKGIVETRRKRGTLVLERSRWNMLDPELISWSRRDGSVRVREELWSALVEAQAALAAEVAAHRRLAMIDEALRAFEIATDAATRRDAFCRLLLEIAAAAGNRFLRSLTSSCVRSLLQDDAAFLDRQIDRLPPGALGAMVAAMRDSSDAARATTLRTLSSAMAPAG